MTLEAVLWHADWPGSMSAAERYCAAAGCPNNTSKDYRRTNKNFVHLDSLIAKYGDGCPHLVLSKDLASLADNEKFVCRRCQKAADANFLLLSKCVEVRRVTRDLAATLGAAGLAALEKAPPAKKPRLAPDKQLRAGPAEAGAAPSHAAAALLAPPTGVASASTVLAAHAAPVGPAPAPLAPDPATPAGAPLAPGSDAALRAAPATLVTALPAAPATQGPAAAAPPRPPRMRMRPISSHTCFKDLPALRQRCSSLAQENVVLRGQLRRAQGAAQRAASKAADARALSTSEQAAVQRVLKGLRGRVAPADVGLLQGVLQCKGVPGMPAIMMALTAACKSGNLRPGHACYELLMDMLRNLSRASPSAWRLGDTSVKLLASAALQRTGKSAVATLRGPVNRGMASTSTAGARFNLPITSVDSVMVRARKLLPGGGKQKEGLIREAVRFHADLLISSINRLPAPVLAELSMLSSPAEQRPPHMPVSLPRLASSVPGQPAAWDDADLDMAALRSAVHLLAALPPINLTAAKVMLLHASVPHASCIVTELLRRRCQRFLHALYAPL